MPGLPIEDDFAAGRPAWERAGAILTTDVGPYERIKLRMLNGAHSTLAYLAQLADCELVSDAAPFTRAIRALMAVDVAPTLEVPEGFDLADYQEELLSRFANPALRHRTDTNDHGPNAASATPPSAARKAGGTDA